MTEITKPILLDETGQNIVLKLDEIKSALTPGSEKEDKSNKVQGVYNEPTGEKYPSVQGVYRDVLLPLSLNKLDTLVSGTNIKTLNGQSLLGSGDINIQSATWGNIVGDINDQTDLITELDKKQATLVSGTNIKTINNQSVLGSGNFDINTGTWGKINGSIDDLTDLQEVLKKKAGSLWQDTIGVYGEAETWWLLSKELEEGDIPEDYFVAGPYSLGGGGGGSSTTEVTVYNVTYPSTISKTAASCNVNITWLSIKTSTGKNTGNVTMYVLLGDAGSLETKLIKTKVPLATEGRTTTTIDVISVLADIEPGTYSLLIKVVDSYNGWALSDIFLIKTVVIELTSSFDNTLPFTSAIPFIWIPNAKGLITTLHLFIDDTEVFNPETGERYTADGDGTLKIATIAISYLTHGSHIITAYFTCEPEGSGTGQVSSNTLVYDIIYVDSEEESPIISSNFLALSLTLYITFNIPYMVYDPVAYSSTAGKAHVKFYVTAPNSTKTLEKELDIAKNAGLLYWECRPSKFGNYTYSIECSNTAGTATKEFEVEVVESDIPVKAVTEDLTLYLTATGRSNQESAESRKTWEYSYTTASGEIKTYSATLSNFNFSTSDGWILDSDKNTVLRVTGNARVTIPYKIFEKNFIERGVGGKTIEVEFATRDVINFDASIISCITSTSPIGLNITAQNAVLSSSADDAKLSSSYKDNEHVRLAFVVQKYGENNLMYMLINGIMSGLAVYDDNTIFKLGEPVGISIGSSEATTDIYCIRIYDNDLTYTLLVNNWIADTQAGELKAERYLRNDVFVDNTTDLSMTKIKSNLPSLPLLVFSAEKLSDGKKTKVDTNVVYSNNADSTKSFTATGAQHYVLGTSSASYYRKNYRINYSKSGFDINGEHAENYSIRNNSIPTNLFTYKVDVASSEGANNVELVRLYEDASPVDTPAKKLNSKVRMGIDGIPTIMFYNNTTDGTTTFYSKANFNNDKSTSEVYGFEDGDESWETLDNASLLATYRSDDFDSLVWDSSTGTWVKAWTLAFEGRYPDGNTDVDKHLRQMVSWVYSTNRNPYYQVTKPDTWTNFILNDETAFYDKFNILNGIYSFIYVASENKWRKVYTLINKPDNLLHTPITITKFKEMCPTDGEHIFTYKASTTSWYYNDVVVSLVDYGIGPYTGTAVDNDLIIMTNVTEIELVTVIVGKDGDVTIDGDVIDGDTFTLTRTILSDNEKTLRLQKFKDEFEDYFNKDNTLYYYVFTELFLLVDSRAKNAFPTYYKSREDGDGGDRWFWIPYDMDTAIGTNNKGLLAFSYSVIDADTLESGAPVFNCGYSAMWENVKDAFKSDINKLYQNLRAGSYINYDTVENRFEEHQSKWSENIFNADAYTKYIVPIIEKGSISAYGQDPTMVQGSKEQQRKWWLYNRFKYLDNRYHYFNTDNAIDFRFYKQSNLTLTIADDMFATIEYGNENFVQQRVYKGDVCTLQNTKVDPSDVVGRIYTPDGLTQIDGFFEICADKIGLGLATKLKRIKLGDATKQNTYLGVQNGIGVSFGNNIMLEYIDIRNCVKLTQAINVPNCISLKEFYADGSVISGATFPENGTLQQVHLPRTITSLKINNQPKLIDFNLDTGVLSLTQLWLEAVPFNLFDLERLVSAVTQGFGIRLVGLNKTVESIDDVKYLYKLLTGGSLSEYRTNIAYSVDSKFYYNYASYRVTEYITAEENTSFEAIESKLEQYNYYTGIDSTGKTEGVLLKDSIGGTIHIDNTAETPILYKNLLVLKQLFPNVDITANYLYCDVLFDNDGAEFDRKYVNYGSVVAAPTNIPTRAETPAYKYEFKYWALNGEEYDFSQPVKSDLTLNAVYDAIDQVYTVHFDLHTSLIPQSEYPDQQIKYLGYVTKPAVDPSLPDATFNGWYKEDEEHVYDFENTPVEGAFTINAHWVDESGPNVTLTKVNFNTFKFTIKDNVAVTHYAITTSPDIPSESDWIAITPTDTYVGTKTITASGTYYVWGKDAAGKISDSRYIIAYAINRIKPSDIALPDDVKINIYCNGVDVGNAVFGDTYIKANFVVDEHYKDIKYYCNDTEIIDGYETLVNSDLSFKVTASRKEYTVTFDMNGKGIQVPPQTVAYYNLATEPKVMPVGQDIVEGWYTTQECTAGTRWSFSNRVTQSILLYANWLKSTKPTSITVLPSGTNEITLNFTQDTANGVQVTWGDESTVETSDVVGNVSLTHIYENTQLYTLEIQCITGSHKIGINASNPVIKPVTSIKAVDFAYNMQFTNPYVFNKATNLTSIVIPYTMTKLAEGMFYGCTSLSSIDLSQSSIDTIETLAFYGCTGLGEIIVPDTVTYIGDTAFCNCTSLEKFNSPASESLEYGTGAFSGCTSLASFNFTENISKIAPNMFEGCSSLIEIAIPKTVDTLGAKAFRMCTNLVYVRILSTNLTAGGETGFCCFEGCTGLITCGPISETRGVYNIEYSWTDKIPDYIFSVSYVPGYDIYASITTVVIHNDIKEIGKYAFSGNNKLTTINFTNSLITIGEAAFYNCRKLTNITLPENLKTLGNNAFRDCKVLGVEMIIPTSVTTIGYGAFRGCTSLRKMYIRTKGSTVRAEESSQGYFIECGYSSVYPENNLVLYAVISASETKEQFGEYWNYSGVADYYYTIELIPEVALAMKNQFGG